VVVLVQKRELAPPTSLPVRVIVVELPISNSFIQSRIRAPVEKRCMTKDPASISSQPVCAARAAASPALSSASSKT